MATPFSTVYQRFLNKVTDSQLASLLPDIMDSVMLEFLQSSIVRFRKCKQNIKDFDLNLKQFNVDLSLDEIEILALWMRSEWLDQQIYRIDLAKQRLSSKDYAVYSPANHINALTSLREVTTKDVNTLMKYYSYDNSDLSELSNRNEN